MNLAMYILPSNLKSSLHKTWQTLLLFLKPLQIQTLKRKKWGDMGYYIPTWKSGGTRLLYSPPNCAHVTNHDFDPDYKLHQPKLHGSPPSEYTPYWTFFHRSRFLSNLRLPWKNRVALKFFTVLNIRFAFRILTTCAFPENRVSPENFHCIEYIF